MTQNKKIVKGICFASAGLATVALTVSLGFAVKPGVVVGQTPTAEPQATATAPTTSATPATAAIPDVATGAGQNLAATTNPAPITPGSVDYGAAIRDRIRQLQATLQQTPTSAQEQLAQQQTVAEMTRLQAELQRLEATTGNFAAYRAARDAQRAQLGGATNMNQPLGTAQGVDPSFAGFGVANGQIPGAARQDVLAGSGLDGGLAGRVGAGATLTPGEAAMLREQKEGLTQQYRQIQQTLRALQPGDEALAENLRREQETLLAQLKDIDARLVNAPAQPVIPTAPEIGTPVVPPSATLPLAGPAIDDVLGRMQKAQQAAQLLREAGLPQLAGHVVSEIPRMSAPDFSETTLVAGRWTENAGSSDEANNPFYTVSPKDIEGINNSINDLKTRVDKLGQTLADVETQLKLLTRQQVSAYIAQPEPQAPAAAPTQELEQLLDEPPTDSEPSEL